jgi:hypothetical protein
MDLLFLKERDREIMTGERERETKSMTGQKSVT